MEGGKKKNDIPGHLARVSYPDESRRRFLRFAGLGTLSIAAAASRAHAADAEELVPAPVPPRTGGHARYMRRAIALAKQVPAFPFGAVIVRRAIGVIVAEGHNRSSESPSFHGEIVVINRCAADHPSIDWAELDLHHRRTLPHVSGSHRVGGDPDRLLRDVDPSSATPGLAANRDPRGRSRAANALPPKPGDRRNSG